MNNEIFEPYVVGTKVAIKVMDTQVIGKIGGYVYNLSGHPSSFFFEENPYALYPIERLDAMWCVLLAPPEEIPEE